MVKKVFYEKVGRRYKPVREYDGDFVDSFSEGAHLVMCYPGVKTVRHNIDPNYAAMIAAGRIAEEAISNAIVNLSEIRLRDQGNKTPLTLEQQQAWQNLVKVFGESARQLSWPSAHEVAQESVKCMMKEAEKLMQHESVKQAFEQFLMVCELTKKHPVDQK